MGHLRVGMALAAVAAVMACTTAATTPPAPVAAAKQAVRAAVAVQPPRAVAGIALTAAVQPVSTSSRHSAFPSIAQAPDGSLVRVSRGGTDHVASRDGSIYRATSRDLGRTWTGETAVPLPVGHDYRDPSISYVADTAGVVHEYLTFFTGSATLGAEGAYVSRDGGPAVRIDALPYAAISAPVVLLPNGQLGTAFYGRKAGESIDTAWMAWSSDAGQSWTTNRILNDGSPHPEPVLLVRNGVVHLLARGGSDTIVMRSSTNSGASGSWDNPHVIVGACTGRPSAMVTTAGTMVMVCRGTLPSLNAQVAYSVDGGSKWWWGPRLLTAPAGPIGMTYAALYEALPGVIHVVAGMEQADGGSVLYGGYLAESVT